METQNIDKAKLSKNTESIDVVEIPQDPIQYTEEEINRQLRMVTEELDMANRMIEIAQGKVDYWQALKDKFAKQ